MPLARRTFLQGMSAATACGALGGARGRLLWAATPAELPSEPDEAVLRDLALVAVDAARTAGATFADVRIAAGRQMVLYCNWLSHRGVWMMGPDVTIVAQYGIRAIMDGAWGFAGGSELTADAVRNLARVAVRRARSNRPRHARTLELAAVPSGIKGTWAVSIAEDPFGVPVGEQADLAMAALDAASQVPGLPRALVTFRWARSTRVFASSDGSLITQRMGYGVPSASAGSEGVEVLQRGAVGYETVRRINLREELRQAAVRAVADARRPRPRSAEVGRYDLVFGAPAVAGLLTSTIGQAVNLERALGYRANDDGTSFAASPSDILGQYQVGAPLLTVHADRTRPHGAATVGWDDEGVPAGEHTLVRDGIIVDYLTSRQTATELATWYRATGQPVRSHGCASGVGLEVPGVRLPNLVLEPGPEDIEVADLIADTKRGYYIENASAVSDQQVLNTQARTSFRSVYEIRNGKLGNRVRDLGFQFITPTFWQSVDAIGGPDSVVDTVQGTGVGPSPLQVPMATVRAVPARVRDVNVLNYGGTL